MSRDPFSSRAGVMRAAMDATGASALQFDFQVNRNRAPLPVWCGAYLLGGVFTLLWFMALTGMLQSTPAVDRPQVLEIELIPPQQLEAPPPTPVSPLQPRRSPPKPAQPKPSEAPRQPQLLTAPNADENVAAPPEIPDPPPSEEPPTASPPVVAPMKIEPLFRLTRLPDFGNVTTLKYPAAEKNRGREGTVIAEFVIDEKGAVSDIKILKSAGGLFDQAVIDELSKTVFSPSYIGERAVAARFRREFQFKLD